MGAASAAPFFCAWTTRSAHDCQSGPVQRVQAILVGMKTAFAIAIASAALAACAPAPFQQHALAGSGTSIPFAAHGGIRDWHSSDDQSIYLRDRSGRWYFAMFNGVCPSLRAAQTIQFVTDPAGTFDGFSSIITEYGRCQVALGSPLAGSRGQGRTSAPVKRYPPALQAAPARQFASTRIIASISPTGRLPP